MKLFLRTKKWFFWTLLLSVPFLNSCETANLTPINGQRICDDVGYALSSRAYQCGASAQNSNALFQKFYSDYQCDAQSVENELLFLGLQDVYSCIDSIRSAPCDSVNHWNDSLDLWFNKFSNCKALTQVSTNLNGVQIDSSTCGQRYLQLPATKGAVLKNAEKWASEGPNWSVGFWIKGNELPDRAGILGAEMEVSGTMTALIQDKRTAVQRLRIATGNYEGCAESFPNKRLSIELGNHSIVGTGGGLYEAEIFYTDAVNISEDWSYWLIVKSGVSISLYVDGSLMALQKKYCNYANGHSKSVDSLSEWTTPFYLGAISDRGTMVRASGLAFDDLKFWNSSVNIDSASLASYKGTSLIKHETFDSLSNSVDLPIGSKLEASVCP